MQNNKKKALIGLKKASSLLNKIIKMTEENHYCINIMQQNLAVVGLLRSVHETMMKNHLDTCFKNAMSHGTEKKKKETVEEILRVARLYNK